MSRGVIFGEFNTVEDWDLIRNSKEISPPVPKKIYIKVDGRDGDLDFSETLTGEIRYENRLATFIFLLTNGTYDDRELLIAEITNNLHGKLLSISLTEKPDYYLKGRCSVVDVKNDKGHGSITIEATCEPYFYSAYETIYEVTVIDNTQEYILVNNGVKTLVPEIKVTGTITLKYNNASVSLSEGTHKLADLRLKRGNTLITVEGSGTVIFTYREGVLYV